MAVSFELNLMLLRVLGHVGGLLHVDFGLLTPFRGSNNDFRKKCAIKKLFSVLRRKKEPSHDIVAEVVCLSVISI